MMEMSTETRAALLRGALLFGPLALAVAAALWQKPSRRMWGGLLVAAVWTFVSLLALNLSAVALDLWSFGAVGGTHRGVPVDVLLGWTALWGMAFPLAFRRAPLAAAVAAALWLDVLTMPAAEPIVRLEGGWWWGEAAALLFSFLPAQLAYRWTQDDRRLSARTALQVIAFGGFTFWVLGDLAIVAGSSADPAAAPPLAWWTTPANPFWLVLAAVGGLISLSAVLEFRTRGGGTPIPWDPPKRLVTSGLYRYVRNPMQVGMWIALPAWGLAYGSWLLVAAGGVSIAFSTGLARWHETEDFLPRFGASGRAYRAAVPWGWPRVLPHVPSTGELFYGAGCDVCEPVAQWIRSRGLQGLDLVPAQSHPNRDLDRLTYRHEDGAEEEGVAALARALEHVNMVWALLGSVLRLPVVQPLVQLIVDVSGGGPRLIPRASGGTAGACSTRRLP